MLGRAAATLRCRAVVLWLPGERLFRAYPKFRAPRGTIANASQPNELAAQMNKAELTTRRPAARS
jgi:hypothetical protein